MLTPLTGRKVLALFTLGFGTIIAVNLTLAVNAVRTFPGLEVANSYVASQKFDDERAKQAALGWTLEARADAAGLRVALTDPTGTPVRAAEMALTLGRPTTDAEDRALAPDWDGTAYRAGPLPGPGAWLLHVNATAADGTPYRSRVTLHGRAPS